MEDCSSFQVDEKETIGRRLLFDNNLDLKKVNGHDLEEGEGHARSTDKKAAGCGSPDDPAVWRWFVVAGVLILPLSDKCGPRLVIMLGGVFLFIGLLSSAFAPHVYTCIATFGFFVGCGCSMTYLSASTVIMFYFKKERALAQAIVVSGSAAGVIVLPICVQYLNDEYTWRGGLIIAAAMSLNVCASGALIRPIKTSKDRSRDITPESPKPTRGIRHPLKKLLHSRPFILLCVQSIFMQAALAMITMHIKATAIEKTGVSDELGSSIVSFYGAALFTGVLSAGIATRVIKIEPIILLQIHYFCCACGISLIPASNSFPALVCFTCIFAYFTAANGVILPLVLFTLVGEDAIRIAWALRYVFSGIGGLAGPAIAGALYDYTKDYYNSMYLGGAGIFLSIILMIEPCVTLTRAKKPLELGRDVKSVKDEMWRSIASLPGSVALFDEKG
ncbi:monocarboxylate transporter 9-like isoform X2 [Lineus longissimus]|uniref:monocarboxylate transporter 9-like isoform X2 n=1 Tax=Lineus longissimus TaxID=88925 RepID=UPI00315D3875